MKTYMCVSVTVPLHYKCSSIALVTVYPKNFICQITTTYFSHLHKHTTEQVLFLAFWLTVIWLYCTTESFNLLQAISSLFSKPWFYLFLKHLWNLFSICLFPGVLLPILCFI